MRLEVGRKLLMGKISEQLCCLEEIGLSKSPSTQAESNQLNGTDGSQKLLLPKRYQRYLPQRNSVMLKQLVRQPVGNPSSLVQKLRHLNASVLKN